MKLSRHTVFSLTPVTQFRESVLELKRLFLARLGQWVRGSSFSGVGMKTVVVVCIGCLFLNVSAQEGRHGDLRRPPPIPPPPPLEQFLGLLSASPQKRQTMLADKGDSARKLILSRIEEFESLSPAQRERRLVQLRLAQFRYYMSPLLRADENERSALIEAAPEADRPLLVERLAAWDALTPGAREEILESERHFHFFIRHQTADRQRLDEVLAAVPPRAQRHVERQFEKWSALSPAERTARTVGFQRFFDLTDAERSSALTALPERDRRLMERTLTQFQGLPKHKQDEAIRGFAKFVGLSDEERQDFLFNALQWQAMTGEERAAWRRLILDVPAAPPIPPIPPGHRKSSLVSTNSVPSR